MPIEPFLPNASFDPEIITLMAVAFKTGMPTSSHIRTRRPLEK